ncbi:DUF2515 domain-containing protein [Fictibacillus nanhaiensis]|uniref:DUF2515 family protein n=1 Tax=Fictibacillus nanhaiensis TaxID=742169 RepID=UPI001C986B5B|nr:DUF2515 family protein [Fictibacillus nanhaiensis]MBY6035871.1 DUF2515 domain-containing protein [Fictibacillus nanhaiensis]
MNQSTRILTKLTLIPLNFLYRATFLFTKEKTVWEIKKEQQQALSIKWGAIQSKTNGPYINFQKEKELIHRIRKETEEKNKNNITRTSAYLSFFKKHPEIHWSFLAHMVSRNAGYFMTDLKGEFLSHILEEGFSRQLYDVIEKGNSIIFQDAYPQLLIYEESKKRQKPLFFLCKYFNISPFMEGVWDLFFQSDRSPLLQTALIINEQSHIEELLIKTDEFQALIRQLSYRLQQWLHLSQILFPVFPFKKTTGKTMQNFEKLEKRIALGQNLYILLFHSDHFDSVFQFACDFPHTGSRSDYDPEVFTHQPLTKAIFKEKLSLFKTKNHQKLYSPSWKDAWDQTYDGPFSPSNWFTEESKVWPKIRLVKKTSSHVWMAYWAGLHKMETAYLLKHYSRLFKKK